MVPWFCPLIPPSYTTFVSGLGKITSFHRPQCPHLSKGNGSLVPLSPPLFSYCGFQGPREGKDVVTPRPLRVYWPDAFPPSPWWGLQGWYD